MILRCSRGDQRLLRSSRGDQRFTNFEQILMRFSGTACNFVSELPPRGGELPGGALRSQNAFLVLLNVTELIYYYHTFSLHC